jgi:3-deoxy-D-manno-octulosonic-acid transferase
MRWLLYNLLFAVAFVLALPRYLWRMRKRGGYGRHFAQRFGLYANETLARLRSGRRVWLHAVSVGEILVALRFMRELRAADPALTFVLTTNTPTARALAAAQLDEKDVLLYFPTDFPVVMRRALRLIKPLALILTEKELWPNLIRLCQGQGVPVILINGRMSPASAAGYRKARFFFAPLLRNMTLVLAQSEQDRARFLEIGTHPARTQTVPSAKYDGAQGPAPDPSAARTLLARAGTGPDNLLLLGGSTWPGEEAALCRIYLKLRKREPRLRLALVPRHAERRAAIARDIVDQGLRPLLRSALTDPAARPPVSADTTLVVDSTGELTAFYACADLVFVGKSLGPARGGQNMIEPAWLGKPVAVGPHMENFPVIMDDFLRADAIAQVSDENELLRLFERWLDDEKARRDIGRRAREVVLSKQGGVRTSVEKMLPLLTSATGDPRNAHSGL